MTFTHFELFGKTRGGLKKYKKFVAEAGGSIENLRGGVQIMLPTTDAGLRLGELLTADSEMADNGFTNIVFQPGESRQILAFPASVHQALRFASAAHASAFEQEMRSQQLALAASVRKLAAEMVPRIQKAAAESNLRVFVDADRIIFVTGDLEEITVDPRDSTVRPLDKYEAYMDGGLRGVVSALRVRVPDGRTLEEVITQDLKTALVPENAS